MDTSSYSHIFVLCLALTGLNYVLAMQPEFLRSFILRPWMLSNASVPEPPVQQGPVTLSLYVDNWSPFSLILASDRLDEGVWETSLEPRNMGAKRRDLLFRTVSSQGTSGVRTSGVVGWTLTNGSEQPTQFTIAWDVGNGGKPSKFSAALGSFVPTGEEMWLSVPKMISKGLTSIQSSNQLDDTVYLSHPKVALAAVNMTLKDGEGLHYKIFVSLIPPNVDVWGWVKYYRETVDDPMSKKHEGQHFSSHEDVASKNSKRKGITHMELEMVTKVKKTSSNIEVKMIEVEQRDDSEMFTDSPTTSTKETTTTTQTTTETTTTSPTTPSTTSTTTTTTSTTTSTTTKATTRSSTTLKQPKPSTIALVKPPTQVDGEKPLHEQKHLLRPGRALTRLDQKNLTLRGALAGLPENIAVAIQIENWSRFPLTLTQLKLVSGKTLESDDSLAPPPATIEPGAHDFGVVLQATTMGGTNGVVRWSIGTLDRVLSLMWSVPYNRQLWRTWLAVGLTSHGSDLPSYDDMYAGQGGDGRFVRRKAGHQFEFSDGQFIVVAQMDGDATFKPVLHLVVAPIASELLAPSIRKHLGMKNIPEDGLIFDGAYSKNTQKRQDGPTVGHVHSTNGGRAVRTADTALTATLIFIAIISTTIIAC